MDFFNQSLHFCVLIPCYNDEPGLIQSLKSIQYEAEQWLAVVVDDGSKEPLSYSSIKEQAGNNLQLHLIILPQNAGITKALNKGLEWIINHTEVPYIARLDCRDLCDAERFYKQTAFLNSHPEVGLLGSWCYFKEEKSNIRYQYTTPVEHEAIKKAMPLHNVFIHPTVMFRSSLIRQVGYYPYNYPFTEDYAFFWKMLKITKSAVLPFFLVTCAVTRTGISLANRQKQMAGRKKAVRDFADDSWIKWAALIKIYLLTLLPKTLLLKLKSLLK